MKDTVLYKGVEYPIMDIYLKSVGTVNVSVDSLAQALNPTDNWADVSEEAEYIDNKIAYYVPDSIMKKSIEEITEFVNNFH